MDGWDKAFETCFQLGSVPKCLEAFFLTPETSVLGGTNKQSEDGTLYVH